MGLAALLTTVGCGSGGENTTTSGTGTGTGTGGQAEGGGGTGGDGEGAGGDGGEGGAMGCQADTDCDDGVGCTVGTCDDGVCSFANDDTACDDGAYCNGAETCDPASGDPTTGCVAGADPCDDGVGCTTATCDEGADTCTQTNDDTICDDGTYCNGAEICDPQNGDPTTGCAAGTDPCDDGLACTDDSCDESADSCLNDANHANCDDSLFCNGVETCDPQNGDPVTGCLGGSTPCDDGITCTVDACDENNDSCSVTLDDTVCVDAVFCDGDEVCDPPNGDPTTGCRAALSPACQDGIDCTDDVCDENNDSCTNPVIPSFCDDGLLCTGVEFCSLMTGQCESTGQADCNDNVGCTSDFCDTTTDSCVNVPQASTCTDGLFCNGAETCDPVNDCQPGTAPNCDDGVACTQDSCDETNDVCAHQTNNSLCDDGQFCNGPEICSASSGCIPGEAPICDDQLDCTADSCDEGNDTCVNAPNDNFCDDSLFCNGAEVCDVNAAAPGDGCVSGNNVQCVDDGIACTVESCDEATMGCISTADNTLCTNPSFPFCVPSLGGCVAAPPCNTAADCDDMDDCNGIETCNVVCQPGTPVNCNDGISCTIDSCNPGDGTCNNVPSDMACDDGFVCNGFESCDTMVGCVMGTPVDCNDGVSCTVDTCNENMGGTCDNTPSAAACNDNVFCNGLETCDPVADCQAGTPPSCDDGVACTADICDATIDQCINQTDNSVCPCGETCDPQLGCGNYCEIKTCQGKTYQCGDCIDNDNDCTIDSADLSCFGPCDNNEAGFKGNIPGQNSAPCKQDCYFDGDTGAGNDDCYWSHDCDPNQVAPDFYPEGPQCSYNPNANIPGTNLSCMQLDAGPPGQSQDCLNYCGPLTPNGCDCFGCCDVPGVSYPIWLGSENNNQGSCTLADLGDPTKCKPCEIVDSCHNPCDNCEICLGKPTLPPECLCQECAPGQQLCGDPCGTPCPFGFFCQSGCCVQNPG